MEGGKGRKTVGLDSRERAYKCRLSRPTTEGLLRDMRGKINLQASFLSKCGHKSLASKSAGVLVNTLLSVTLNQILWGWDPLRFIVKAALLQL